MKTIHLVRHGQVLNPERRIYGLSDIELLDPHKQILKVLPLESLRDVSVIVSSDLRRCRSSAECLAHHLNIPLIITEQLREQSFGDWEGLTWDEVRNMDVIRWECFFSDWINERPPGGESFSDMAKRILDYYRQRENKPGTELWITHAGPIRVVLCYAADKQLSTAFDYECPFYSCHRIPYMESS